MHMKRSNKILVGCLTLLLALTVGYALFSETITINGTATAKGNFDIEITCDVAYVEGEPTGNCSTGNNSITAASTLTKPGEAVYYEVNITNNGTIPARIKKITTPNNVLHDWQTPGDCAYVDKTSYLLAYIFAPYSCDSEYEENEVIIQPGETLSSEVDHMWVDTDYHFFGKQPVLPNGEASINYKVIFEFEQVTN